MLQISVDRQLTDPPFFGSTAVRLRRHDAVEAIEGLRARRTCQRWSSELR